jgi:hypothetical protein
VTHHDVYFGLVFGTVGTCFVLVVAICAVSVTDWLRRDRPNVTIVRGKAEGPVGFPTGFAKSTAEIYREYDRRESKKTDRVMSGLHKALDEWEPPR